MNAGDFILIYGFWWSMMIFILLSGIRSDIRFIRESHEPAEDEDEDNNFSTTASV